MKRSVHNTHFRTEILNWKAHAFHFILIIMYIHIVHEILTA